MLYLFLRFSFDHFYNVFLVIVENCVMAINKLEDIIQQKQKNKLDFKWTKNCLVLACAFINMYR